MTHAVSRSELRDELRTGARAMLFSSEVIDEFLETAPLSCVRELNDMLKREQDVRARRKRERLLRKARFPQIKSIEDFDFAHVGFPEGYTKEDLRELEFIDKAQDFVFHGQTGRGKTHLSEAIGILAVNKGVEVRFFTAAQLVMMLRRASNDNKLDIVLKDIARARLLIIDELGYVPLDIEGARLLFQVLSDTYERQSMIITTNIEFSKWGTVFGDDKMASAIIDRIVHHGRLVEFGGPSHRMDAALMLAGTKEKI